MSDEFFFSVCIPAYNRSQTIYNTLKSLSLQDFRDFEVKIVDRGSDDQTRREIERFFESDLFKEHPFDYEFKIIQTTPQTLEDWNDPIRMATGRYIAMLEGDDQFLPDYLSRAHAYLSTHENIGIYAAGNTQIGRRKLGPFSSDEYVRYIYSMQEVPPPSETIFLRLGTDGAPWFYNTTDYVYAPEIDLYLRIALTGLMAFHDASQSVYRHPSLNPFKMPDFGGFQDKYLIIDKYSDCVEPPLKKRALKRQHKELILQSLKEIKHQKGIKKPELIGHSLREAGFINFIFYSFLFVCDYLISKSPTGFASRIIIFFKILLNRKLEPLCTFPALLAYLVSGKMYPLKRYNDFSGEFLLKSRADEKYIEKNGEKFFYGAEWSDSLVKDNFNAILNEQEFEQNNTSPHQYLHCDKIDSNWVIYDLGSAEGYQAKLWSKVAKKVVIFEPDKKAFESLNKTFEEEILNHKVQIINVGVSDSKKEISFGDQIIKVDSLPQIIKENGLPMPDFVKADIEGEEMNMLKGARELFDNNVVKVLQVTTYHRPNDYIDVPKFLMRYDGHGALSDGIMVFNIDGMIGGDYKDIYHPIFRKALYTYYFD